jgi:hypothetical protein
MAVLILLLGVIAAAAGMFGLGVGIPAKDTPLGAAMLVSSSVAITGGFILFGLAAAVKEIRRVLEAGMRQPRLPDRYEAERGGRRMEPRLAVPGMHGGSPGGVPAPAFGGGASGGISGGPPGTDAADVIPARFDAPEVMERPRQPVREDRPPADSVVTPPPFPPTSGGDPRRAPVPPPVPERYAPERLAPERITPERVAPERITPERVAAERIPTEIRPADFRKPDQPESEKSPEVRPPPPPPPAAAGPNDAHVPPPLPEAARAARPVTVLKSGKFNDVSYTLFSDGSIETQMPDGGTLRFGSIDDFRRHLEKTA